MSEKKSSVRMSILLFVTVAVAGSGVGLMLNRAQSTSITREDGTGRTRMATSSGRGSQAHATTCGVPIFDVRTSVESDSLAANYDPSALIRAKVAAKALWENERRRPEWAGPMESAIGGILVGDLKKMVGDVAGLTFECRSRTCLASWKGGDEKYNDRIERALTLGAIAPLHSTLGMDEGNVGVLLFFPPEPYLTERYGQRAFDFDASNPIEFARVYQERRAVIFGGYRTGERTIPDVLTGVALPE